MFRPAGFASTFWPQRTLIGQFVEQQPHNVILKIILLFLHRPIPMVSSASQHTRSSKNYIFNVSTIIWSVELPYIAGLLSSDCSLVLAPSYLWNNFLCLFV
jgi:hypothetical protein